MHPNDEKLIHESSNRIALESLFPKMFACRVRVFVCCVLLSMSMRRITVGCMICVDEIGNDFRKKKCLIFHRCIREVFDRYLIMCEGVSCIFFLISIVEKKNSMAIFECSKYCIYPRKLGSCVPAAYGSSVDGNDARYSNAF